MSNPTNTLTVPCFCPAPADAKPTTSELTLLVSKAEKYLQAFSLFGYSVDFVAAAKVVFAAVVAQGATWATVVDAIVANIGTIFPPVPTPAPSPTPTPPPTPAQVRAVFAL